MWDPILSDDIADDETGVGIHIGWSVDELNECTRIEPKAMDNIFLVCHQNNLSPYEKRVPLSRVWDKLDEATKTEVHRAIEE